MLPAGEPPGIADHENNDMGLFDITLILCDNVSNYLNREAASSWQITFQK